MENMVNEIAIWWSVDDVLDVRPDLDRYQAHLVLRLAKNQHDASIGINRGVLMYHAEDLFPVTEYGEAVERSD